MWTADQQTQLERLRQLDARAGLTESERLEYERLKGRRVRHEARALREAAARVDRENSLLEEQVRAGHLQNRALEELIREQEAYLAEVRAIIEQMSLRRQEWRDRYTEVTGQSLGEPAGTAGVPAAGARGPAAAFCLPMRLLRCLRSRCRRRAHPRPLSAPGARWEG